MQADYINFVFKFPNFRYRGNRGCSETNYIAQFHSLTPEQPLGYLVKNLGRISYTRRVIIIIINSGADRGSIGLESPKTTKRDAEGVEGKIWAGGLPTSKPTIGRLVSVVSSPSGVWGGSPAANDFWELHTQFCAISCMF